MTLLDAFAASLLERPHARAVNDATFADLDAGSRRVAARFDAAGLRRGDRVSFFCENRIGFVYAYLAALRLGAIVVPTNLLYRTSDLGHVLQDADAGFVVASAQTLPHLSAVARPVTTLLCDDIERWATDPGERSADLADAPGPDDVATIIYTSGTTGRSKGAMMTHQQLAAIAANLALAWRWTPDEVLVIALPLFHVHGLGAALNTSLAVGSRIVIHERFDASAMLQSLRGERATMFFGVPTMYVRLLEALGSAEAPKLRLWVSGSAALSPELFSEFQSAFGSEILERYGATEFGFALTNRYGGPRVPGSVGIPFPAMRVRVAAPGKTTELTPGEIGELLVSGASVFKGYWRNPAATDAAFSTDDEGTRWYRSGDLAIYDADVRGYRIVGRSKELIISGGFNIYPREVEEEIDRFPDVIACAVVGKADRARGELPVAFVEVRAGFDGEGLLEHLRARLASFKVPRDVIVIDRLPRNALGKIEKHRLRERL